MIEPLARRHVMRVAELHCAALTGLLTALGPAAARAFYEGCTRVRSATGFVSVNAGGVEGFVLGSTQPDALKGEVLRANPFGTLAGLLAGVLRRPGAIRWLLKSGGGPDEGRYDATSPELTYLAVAREARGGGVGRQLVDAFTRAMGEAGAPAYDLSVDDDNEGAIAFYERSGFVMLGRYSEFGILHRRYRRATAPA